MVDSEIISAPKHIRDLFNEMLTSADKIVPSVVAPALRDARTKAGIVTESSVVDALHVALATTAGYALIAGWNFRHIVHFQKVPL